MTDTFTEVTHRSWGSRIGGSLKGLLIGLIFCVVGPGLLWWNEGRAVKTAKSLAEGEAAVVSVAAGRAEAGNNGRLVHTSGQATTAEVLRDDVLGVSAQAIALRRRVEMYQWREESRSEKRTKLGGGEETVTTYSYERAWSASRIDSSSFRKPEGHANPARFPFEGDTVYASRVDLGAFTLSPGLVRQLDAFEPLPVEPSVRPAGVRYASVESGGRSLYLGRDPGSPEVGDVRVFLEVVRPAVVSVVARQDGILLGPYRTRAGRALEMLERGAQPADAMFARAKAANTLLTWILRGAGFLVLFVGLTTLLKPLAVVGDVVPVVGRALGAGIGLVSFLLAGVVSLLVIAVAWLVYRPLLGVALLAGAVALVVAVRALGRRRTAAVPPSVPPPLPAP